MVGSGAGGLERRYVALRATRWLPTGLVIPVLVLLLTSRGLSLGQIGVGLVFQGLVVFGLELPTGGLADVLGRRTVLLAGTLVEGISIGVLLAADSVGWVIVVFALQGVYRALESGPLDAWYVDEVHATSPGADVTRGLARGGAAAGLAIAGGALLSGGLVALDPIAGVDALTVPVAAAVVLRTLDLGAIAALMTDRAPARGRAPLVAAVREVPAVIAGAVAAIRSSTVLVGLIAVEFCWGFGMTSFETLFPPRLAEVVDSTDRAAAIFGPVVTAAWLMSAGGAAFIPLAADRFGAAAGAMVLHLAQAAAVVAMALVAGPAAAIVLYLVTLGLHGALNPLYQTLVHRHAGTANRTTIVSATSMAAHPGGALGGLALGALADRTSVSAAMVAGAVVLAGAAPLYVPALRHRHAADAGAGTKAEGEPGAGRGGGGDLGDGPSQ